MKNKNQNIKIGISVGDTNGVGIELILKTFADHRMFDFCTPIVFASNKCISVHQKKMKLNTTFNGIQDIKEAKPNKLNILNIWKENIIIEFGKPTEQSGAYAIQSFKSATESLKKGEIDALVTAPIHKDAAHNDDFKYLGHTKYLDDQFEDHNALMFMVSEELKVALLTEHIPIKEVSKHITHEYVREKIKQLERTLIQDFGVLKPRIAVLGINPHAGDNGIIGDEDEKILKPVIKELMILKKLVFGPYSADGFFGNKEYQKFDAVMAVYHDQGLIPFKSISFGEGVNYTAGLPIIRTSPDHGTAYDIAGRGIANESSFRHAIYLAIQIAKQRNSKGLE